MVVVLGPSRRPSQGAHGRDPTMSAHDHTVQPLVTAPAVDSRPVDLGADPRLVWNNICLMHLLERIAGEFNRAGVPLMVLKGAALNLALCEGPGDRPMSDLDLMVRVEHSDRASTVLEQLGCRRGVSHVREDFFPRFHYEMEYRAGRTWPLRIDLHVRPFRPLRYAGVVGPEAFWSRAEPVRIGEATVLVPAPGDMLIHLAAHAAVHGFSRGQWLKDVHRWAFAYRDRIDWDEFISAVREWRLAAAVQAAADRVEDEIGRVCPDGMRQRLFALGSSWRDRLALAQAPRDAGHPAAHVLVNLLCTPGWRFGLAYLRSMLIPDSVHMGEWYSQRHIGWLPVAHLLRLLSPVIRLVPSSWKRPAKIEVKESGPNGVGVFAARDLTAGKLIAGCHGRETDRPGPGVVRHCGSAERVRLYELTGQLRFLNHSCHPCARLCGFELRALRPIAAGQRITIDYRQDCAQWPECQDRAATGQAADGAAAVAC